MCVKTKFKKTKTFETNNTARSVHGACVAMFGVSSAALLSHPR